MGSAWNGTIMEMETPSQEALGWEEQKPLGKVHPEGQELRSLRNRSAAMPGGTSPRSVVGICPAIQGTQVRYLVMELRSHVPAERLSLCAATGEPTHSNKDPMYSN